MARAIENRRLSTGATVLGGAIIGAICFLIAESLIPATSPSPAAHDLMLARRLGLIYTPIVGFWLGWLQRSIERAAWGGGLGMLVGLVYGLICSPLNFLINMVAFPCLLGGFLAAMIGSNRSKPWFGLPARFGKGLLAGLVLGAAYMVVLNALGALSLTSYHPPTDYVGAYVAMMWRTGPVALAVASGFFFNLMSWALAISRPRVTLPGHCPKCDYDLTGNSSGICPECGEAITTTAR